MILHDKTLEVYGRTVGKSRLHEPILLLCDNCGTEFSRPRQFSNGNRGGVKHKNYCNDCAKSNRFGGTYTGKRLDINEARANRQTYKCRVPHCTNEVRMEKEICSECLTKYRKMRAIV